MQFVWNAPSIRVLPIVLVQLAGCVPRFTDPCFFEALANIDECSTVELSGTLCDQVRTSELCVLAITPAQPQEQNVTLREVPRPLAAVLEHRSETFLDDHPLQDAPLGSPIGPMELLNGCWSRVQNETYDDGSAEWIEVEWLRIDLMTGSFNHVGITGVDGNSCLCDSRPYIQVFEEKVIEVTSNQISLEILGDFDDRTTAGMNSDGTLTFHLVARFGWEIGVGSHYEKSFIVDGDFLATSKNRGAEPETDRDLWVRTACPD